MPRKTRSSHRPSGGGKSLKKDMISVPFSYIKTSTAGTTVTSPLAPSGMSLQIAAMADVYEEYRVVKLRFRAHPAAVLLAAGFVAGVTDTPPVSVSDIASIPNHVFAGTGQTVPTGWCNVPRKVLCGYVGPLGWYKTIAGTPDPSVEVQGNIYYASGTATSVSIEVEGIIQFCTQVVPGATPAMRRAATLAKLYRDLQVVMAQGPAAVDQMKQLKSSSVTPAPLASA